MEIVSTRDFRSNQGMYLDMAKAGKDIVIKSRNHGSFRIVPVNVSNIASDDDELTGRICQGLREVKMIREGKLKAQTMEELLNEL